MYYVIEISTGDAKIAGKAVYQYATIDEATATFHSKLGTAMKSDLYETELVLVIGAEGEVMRSEKYTRTQTETAPVE